MSKVCEAIRTGAQEGMHTNPKRGCRRHSGKIPRPLPTHQWITGLDPNGLQHHIGDATGPMGITGHLGYIQDSPLQELIDVDAESKSRDRGEPSASVEPEFKRLKSEQRLVKDAVSLLSQRCDQLACEVAELNSTSPYVVGKKATSLTSERKNSPRWHGLEHTMRMEVWNVTIH